MCIFRSVTLDFVRLTSDSVSVTLLSTKPYKQETLIKLFQCTCLRMGQKRRLVEGHPTFDAGGSDAQIISGGTTGVATAEMNAPFWDCPSGEQGRFPLSAAASTSSYVGTGYVELEGTSYETAHRWPARARPGATLRIKIRNMK